MDDERISISDYISGNYNKLKRFLLHEWHKTHTTDFDEDLFHNTLLNSLKTLNGCSLTEKEMKNYIIAAFKSNTLRESMYYRNCMKSDVETDFSDLGETVEMDDLDYERIMISIQKTFGEELSTAFGLWVEGHTMREIEEKLKKTQLTYQIKKIREWVNETYSEFKD